MTIYQYQPLASWVDFENLCHDLFKHEWSSRVTNHNGRNGSRQNGVDIYGYPNNMSQLYGVQCKGKEVYPEKKISIDEIKSEIAKALNFEPPLTHFIIATTAKRNVGIQEDLRKYLKEDSSIPFTVDICFWDDLENKLNQNEPISKKFYPTKKNKKLSLIERYEIDDRVNLVNVFDDGKGGYNFNCQYYNLNGSFNSNTFALRFGNIDNINCKKGKQLGSLRLPFNKICYLIEEFFFGNLVESFKFYFQLKEMSGDLSITTSEACISGSYYIQGNIVKNDENMPVDIYENDVFIKILDICKSITFE